MRFYLKRIFLTLIALVFIFVAIIFYPQVYFFEDKIEYKNFQVYYDTKIPDSIYSILDEVDQLIRQSDCSRHKKKKVVDKSAIKELCTILMP